MVAAIAGKVDIGGIKQRSWWRVDQIEHHAEVDGKTFLALTDEDLALVLACRAAGNGDGVDVTRGIGRVVGNRLAADVVNRLFESVAAAGGLAKVQAVVAATRAAHDLDLVAFVDVQRRVIGRADDTRLNQRNRHLGAADWQSYALERVLETELESDVFDRVAGVVEVNLIQRVRVHLEIVGAAVRSLQGLVVGKQCDVVRTTARARGAHAFVTAEHIKIGAIDLGRAGDERCFAVAGSHGCRGRGQQEAPFCKGSKLFFHDSYLLR